jgi:hypothetical protein
MEVNDHDGEAAILWNTFKKRIGQSENPTMQFSLPQLYENNLDPRIL